MKIFKFELENEKDVIIVNASILEKYKFRLALDTAATHCTIDSNVLYFTGYELKTVKKNLKLKQQMELL
jgi:hypothetical protein